MAKIKKAVFIIVGVFFLLVTIAGVSAELDPDMPSSSDGTGVIAAVLCLGIAAVCFYLAFRAPTVKTPKPKKLSKSEILAARLDEVESATELPIISQPAGIILREGELCHYQAPAMSLVIKNEVVGHTGGSSGASFRIAKGVTIRTGGYRGHSVRDNVSYKYPGIFSMTSQRIIMTGEKAFEYPISKLTSLTPYNNYQGITLQFGKATHTMLMDEPYWIPKIIDLFNAERAMYKRDTSKPEIVKRGHDINLILPAQDGGSGDEIPIVSVESHRIDPDEGIPSPPGAVLNYLDAKALEFWNKKRTDFVIPQYYLETAFGRNTGSALDRLLAGGYLEVGSIEKSIAMKTVPELKAILAEKELKTSGNKPELIQRLIDNVPIDELEAMFPLGIYQITPKGEAALEPYTIVSSNDAYGLGLSYYRLMKERTSHPEESDNAILIRLMSEDIQRCYRDKDKSNYQMVITKTARFLHEIGEERSSLECYILSFFVYIVHAQNLGVPQDSAQTYYLAKALDESGKLCGYSFQELKDVIRDTVKSNNPFALGTDENVQLAISQFRSSLGI